MLKNINKEKTQIENHAEEGVQERAAVVSKAAAATTTTTTTTATVGMKRQRRQIVRDDDEETMENNDNHHHSSNGSAADGETNGETIHQQEKKRRLGGYVACKCETPLAALAVEIEEEQKAMTAGAIKAAAAAPTPTIREGKGEPRKGDFTTADTHTTIDDSKEKQFQNSSSETSPLYHNSAHGDCQGEEEGGRKTGDRPTTKAPPTTATKSSNPRNEKHLPVKRLGWILPGKSVEKSNKFLDQIGQAVAEIGFDAELDTDDFFVVGRDNETDQDMFIVTLFEQQVKVMILAVFAPPTILVELLLPTTSGRDVLVVVGFMGVMLLLLFPQLLRSEPTLACMYTASSSEYPLLCRVKNPIYFSTYSD